MRDDDTWEFLVQHSVPEALPLVLLTVAEAIQQYNATDQRDPAIRRAVEYLRMLPPKSTAAALYDTLGDPTLGAAAVVLLKTASLTNLEAALHALKAEEPAPQRALQTLAVDQAGYDQEDLMRMDALLRAIPERFPNRATLGESRGMFKGPVWTCGFCGNDRNGTNSHCSRCRRDQTGFLDGEVTPARALASLTARRAALTALLDAAH
jgi:hypothetical protein